MDISDFWAKSPPNPDGGKGYPLLQHLLDVAAVGTELLALVPCPVPLPCSTNWASALVGCHDLGKATPGFQAKLGAAAGAIGAPDRHDASTVPLLTQQLARLGLHRLKASTFANAVAAHHGNLIPSTEVAAAARWRFTPDWLAAHDQLFDCVVAGIGVDGLPELPPDAAERSTFLQWLMGLTTVADWIGSSDAVCCWERLADWTGNPAAWFAGSRDLARQTLAELGLAGGGLRPVADGAAAVAVALDGRLPRPLQQAVADVIDRLGDEPGLVVIEAPMGEGKSEASFALSRGRGLYLAMPTQATSNALFGRVASFLARAAGTAQLALAHGAGGPAAAHNRLREVGLGTADSGVTAGWWFRGSKRSLLCSNGIGTVDQALVGVLNTRHAFVRLFGLTARTVIFDEVHAYDTYTGELIERLVIWLQSLGCRVVLMSATLPTARRNSILRAWAGVGAGTPNSAYPRVTWAMRGAVRSVTFAASRQQQLTIRPSAADDVATEAVAMALQGARVLVVVNKVSRAQALFQLVQHLVPATLFHARFPMDQRLQIEQSVQQKFGPGGSCTTGHVLVATQVAEQSLDIDMDVLITDIAPVDLVLQRTGRIHRHDRRRPEGFTSPLVLVAGLDQQIPPASLTSYVYDKWLTLRSAAWLMDHPTLELPVGIDLAVQQVYGSDGWNPAPGPLADAITTALLDYQSDQQLHQQWAAQAALPSPPDWGMQHPAALLSDEEAEQGTTRFGTRLGQDSISVIPVTSEHLDNLTAHADFLAGHYLRISHRQLIAAIRAIPLPKGWRDHPGLRHRLPLLLDAASNGPNCRLDPALGLVIGTSGGASP